MWSSTEYTRESAEVTDGGLWTLDTSGGTVTRLDAESGNPLWTTPVGKTTGFAVAVDEPTVYTATALAVIALDAATGDVLWWHLIPHDQPSP